MDAPLGSMRATATRRRCGGGSRAGHRLMRPELRAWISRHSEELSALAITAGGLWLAFRGGWFFGMIGALVALVGAALLIGAHRRLAFRRRITAPGVVEVDEGAIRYYGAAIMGGEIALRDLVEIRLIVLEGHPHWRLRSQQAEALLLPVDAIGADALAHAFTALPGLDMRQVALALQGADGQAGHARIVWQRADRRDLT